ncbi:MAG: radical SAM protein [Vulcanimicrobiota bacterium]
MRSKILLCSPLSEDLRKEFNNYKGIFFPPMGLLLVAQTLKNIGYEIIIFDGNYDEHYKEKINEYAKKNKKEILFLGLYLSFLQIKEGIQIIEAVKKHCNDIKIVVGGPFSSVFPKVVINSGLVDVLCIGDGAEVTEKIADSFAQGENLINIPNIMFKQKNEIIFNKRTHRDKLDEKNMIFYENFLDIESYVNKFDCYLSRNYNRTIHRALPLLTGLGCSYKCSFCENALLSHKHISLSADVIIEYIKYYKKKFSIDSFALMDEDFFIDKKRVYSLIELLEHYDLKIKWGTQCRANYFNDNYINSDVLKALERTGCVRLSIGVESGSKKMLKKVNKGITPEQVVYAAKLGEKSKIYYSYSFIVYLPEETMRDFIETFKFIDKLVQIKKNSFVSGIHTYFAYPGTPLSIEAEQKLGISIEDKFDFYQFGEMSLEEYNSYINPQIKDPYRESMLYYYRLLSQPYKLSLTPKSILGGIVRIIGLIRKKTKFFHFPLELYLKEAVKKMASN